LTTRIRKISKRIGSRREKAFKNIGGFLILTSGQVEGARQETHEIRASIIFGASGCKQQEWETGGPVKGGGTTQNSGNTQKPRLKLKKTSGERKQSKRL